MQDAIGKLIYMLLERLRKNFLLDLIYCVMPLHLVWNLKWHAIVLEGNVVKLNLGGRVEDTEMLLIGGL